MTYEWHFASCVGSSQSGNFCVNFFFSHSKADLLCLYRLGSSSGSHRHPQITANPNFIHSSRGPLDFQQTSRAGAGGAPPSLCSEPFIATMKNMSLRMSSENDIWNRQRDIELVPRDKLSGMLISAYKGVQAWVGAMCVCSYVDVWGAVSCPMHSSKLRLVWRMERRRTRQDESEQTQADCDHHELHKTDEEGILTVSLD